MDDKAFEDKLNSGESFLDNSKNHTAELEKQLEEHQEEHEVRKEKKRKVEEFKRLCSEGEDDTDNDESSGIGGLQ